MTNRLPTVGGDDNNWGTILNDYLEELNRLLIKVRPRATRL
jgi:hypothetical protein